MAMDDESRRREAIAAAIAADLDRQGRSAEIDIGALAEAVELALEPPADEGKHPDELNATNDD